MKKIISNFLSKTFPETWKKYAELNYWKKKKRREGTFNNNHYSFFYTTHFNLKSSFYNNKRILDIGCGPRGSLEWAQMASEKVGLDPLANNYLKLGADKHQMDYVASPSEQIPYEAEYFDIVCSFNSLDHVSNVNESISEIKRVTKPSGLFLLLVEINHEPTNCEPHKLTPHIIKEFKPEFLCQDLRIYKPADDGLYNSIKANKKFADPINVTELGWLSAKFSKL